MSSARLADDGRLMGPDLTEELERLPGRMDVIERKLDALTVSMDRRFEQVNLRFEQVARQFEGVDRRFEQVDQRFEQVDRRFNSIDEHLVEQRQYTEFAYERLREQMSSGFDRIGKALLHTNRRLSDLEEGVRILLDRTRPSPPHAARRAKKKNRI